MSKGTVLAGATWIAWIISNVTSACLFSTKLEASFVHSSNADTGPAGSEQTPGVHITTNRAPGGEGQ